MIFIFFCKNITFGSIGKNSFCDDDVKANDTSKNNGGWNTISVSEVAKGLGIKAVISNKLLQGIGIDMGKLYRAKYNKAPEKHPQFVDGAERMINSYTTKDQDLMEQAIQMHIDV